MKTLYGESNWELKELNFKAVVCNELCNFEMQSSE